MRIQRRGLTLRWISIALILFAVILLTLQLISFSRSRGTYPRGMEIANVPVAGFNREQATERLLEVYNRQLELYYHEGIIHMDPAIIGFQLNLESMLATADLVRIGGSFWNDFWDYLWGNQELPEPVPLDASYSESTLRSYLIDEIGARYDQPAIPSRPQAGTLNFEPGTPGMSIDVDTAVFQIENALFSPTNRKVHLSLEQAAAGRPSFQNLEILLKQSLDIAGFDGVASVYLLDLQTAQEIQFIYSNGVDYPTRPDLAFSASSIIKIPIMVSAYRRLGDNPSPEAIKLLGEMIELSGNDPADWLMEQFIDANRGPLVVTEDMRMLGLENTFLAQHFRLGSPLLAYIQTPANSRTDINTNPDPGNQTTASDIGMLLADIYQCAEYGGGALLAVFPNEITQQECRDMIDTLDRNNFPNLLEAGAPDGIRIAHKHGFVTDGFGSTRSLGDAGIVYTPSGNYILVIYFDHPVQLIWDSASTLFASLAKAVYNYYNIPSS
ncbi:MAG: serine hydrolase [Anaerolineales bacterium]